MVSGNVLGKFTPAEIMAARVAAERLDQAGLVLIWVAVFGAASLALGFALMRLSQWFDNWD